MKTTKRAALAAIAALVGTTHALQPTSDSPLDPPPNGPKSAEVNHHILYGATVHTAPGRTLENAVVEIRDGVILTARELRRGEQPPTQRDTPARLHDLTGEFIYAGFIDPFVEVSAPKPDKDEPGVHYNALITPQRSALDGDGLSESKASAHRKLGFVAANIVPDGGIFAGTNAVVSLAEAPGDTSAAFERVYLDGRGNTGWHVMNFETAGFGGGYPTSHPGVVAVMRQTLLDAAWQSGFRTGAPNALTPLEDQAARLLINIGNEHELFLAHDVATEMDRSAAFVGNGASYQWIDPVAGMGRPMIVPLAFATKPDVSTIAAAEGTELASMMAWEQSPANAARLIEAGVDIALTATKLPKGQTFKKNLLSAVEHGLEKDRALAALTVTPAQLLGVAGQLGAVEPGKRASIIVASGDIFEKDTKIYDLWIDGRPHKLNDRPEGEDADADDPALAKKTRFNGNWEITAPALGMTVAMKVDGNNVTVRPSGAEDIKVDGVKKTATSLRFLVPETAGSGLHQAILERRADGSLHGHARWFDGSETVEIFAAKLSDLAAADDAEDEAADEASPAQADDSDDSITEVADHPGYPFGPYAIKQPPAQDDLVITGATLWTMAGEGTIENGTLVIQGGKVRYAGPARGAPRLPAATRIDATGKHITPGLIDAHSHTGLFRLGVNEGGQAVTSEVRISDSLTPGDANFYRQLASGVTTVLSLHGSANPIGGQSATHKIRWGSRTPQEMRLEDAYLGIKFALGENVKRSRGNRTQTRYPASRMGVETIIRDRFQAAREYQREWNGLYQDNRRSLRGLPAPFTDEAMERPTGYFAELARRLPDGVTIPRRDLELEAVAEILRGERLIHCHSYRQDEILMLARIAQDFGFQIGTYQHALEVYKVAEVVMEVARGASMFADWWAFKMEVQDAIPYSGPLQIELGLNTSYNSDSNDLARRLNLEAAKALKYARRDDNGDPRVTPEQALAVVTINPAYQLGVDDRIGSLERGKDADFVIWSGPPMSTLSATEATYIDGRRYFSIEDDLAHRQNIAAERARLIAKIEGIEDDDEETDDEVADARTADEEAGELRLSLRDRALARFIMESTARGIDPRNGHPGDCGCMLIHHALYFELTDQFNDN
ncbi:MAG: amidohydrolase family protein [Planctomycetota bacterium]